jgi:hypothetical protein
MYLYIYVHARTHTHTYTPVVDPSFSHTPTHRRMSCWFSEPILQGPQRKSSQLLAFPADEAILVGIYIYIYRERERERERENLDLVSGIVSHHNTQCHIIIQKEFGPSIDPPLRSWHVDLIWPSHCWFVCIYICICIYMYIYICICMYVCMYVCMCVFLCIKRVNVYNTHTHTHTHTHTQTHT